MMTSLCGIAYSDVLGRYGSVRPGILETTVSSIFRSPLCLEHVLE